MNTVYYDAQVPDEVRRQRLFDGQLFVYSPRRSSMAFIEFAKTLIKEAFAPHDPEKAQYHMTVESYAEVLGKLKPQFIHHPESKRHLQSLLHELGCDLQKTYFDVPKMRSSTSDNYLTTGIAYAWHPHRDTWYSAPMCQINWWIPIYDIQADNAMAFHPRYWNVPVPNTSNGYNYYLWNQQHRGGHVSQFIKQDPRPLPRPSEELELNPQVRLIVPAGASFYSLLPKCIPACPIRLGGRGSASISDVSIRMMRERDTAPLESMKPAPGLRCGTTFVEQIFPISLMSLLRYTMMKRGGLEN